MEKIKTVIGIVTMEYDESGKLLNSLFEPRMNVRIDQSLMADLRKIECCDDPEILERNAQLVLASYFNRMNKIELRDLAKERIVHEVNQIEKFDNGMIKKAVITYSFEEDEPDDYWVPDPKRPPVIQ